MKPRLLPTNRRVGAFHLARWALCAAVFLNGPAAGIAAQPPVVTKPAVPTVVTTNLIRVTNTVLVTITNFVVETNLVVATNGIAGKPTPGLPPLNWVPPMDGYDWVQLKSGEWLKGRIKAMQDRKLEFESEELDDLTFDWKDVRQVRSEHIHDVLFLDRQTYSGPITITPTEVTVGGAEPHTHPRGDLLGITPGGATERSYWSGKLTVGLTMRAGNTEQLEFNSHASLQRRTPATRLSLDYLGNISSVDNVESANNHRVHGEFDLWLSRRLFLMLPFAEYYKDRFQNLDHRLTVGAGVGYDLIDRPALEWNITAGPAYQMNWFDSVPPGEEETKGAAALVFGSRFDWDITQRIDLILEYRGQFTRREIGETTHHGVSTLELELTKRLDLDISFIWDRINNPRAGADGVEPKRDDFRLVLGLGVDF